ncbi:uncharacterized protein [Euphorbia lathyris]|uniref:uncharacterized protein n=1 Tax=Euphorbia lathyris TaxID=212925 RepID=UPI0033143324
MADLKGIAKARMELEDLYSGIPDDSVNLTFQDLAVIKQKKSTPIETIQESNKSPLNKLPSLDFNRGRRQEFNHHHHVDHVVDPYRGRDGVQTMHGSHGQHNQHHHDRSRAYDDDASMMSMNSMYIEKGGRSRRPGIPHSNICTICSTYIYLFKHRCLVCGRVYCRSCVEIGMGDMTEGRKCIECLGRRFSQRYIRRAGIVGCCSGYSSNVKQAELKWQEKGPRRSGEKAHGQSRMMSRSRSPMNQRSTFTSNSPSFVSTSSYSPYTPHHHHLPL